MKLTALLLLIASGLFSATPSKKAETPKKQKIDLESEYVRAITALEKATKLIKQEQKRWTEIHKKKIQTKPEEATLETTEDDIIVRVTIQPKVENEINAQPITREFHFGRKPSDGFFDYADLGLMGTYTWCLKNENIQGIRGLLPGLFLGLRLLDHWAKIPKAARGWGFGAYCNVFTAGATLYYSHPAMKHASLHLLVGWDYKGNIAPGFALGVRF